MRVVIADDSLLFREGLASLLTRHGFDVVGQATDGDHLVGLVTETAPELAIIDIRMPPSFTTEGIEAAAQLARLRPEVGVVVLSQFLESDYAVRLLEGSGAGRGYLLKDRVADLARFIDSLRRVAGGESVVDAEVVDALVHQRRASDVLAELSAREREILHLMAEGLSNNGVSERLHLSPRTTEGHVNSIFRKLRLDATQESNRRVLAVLALLRATG